MKEKTITENYFIILNGSKDTEEKGFDNYKKSVSKKSKKLLLNAIVGASSYLIASTLFSFLNARENQKSEKQKEEKSQKDNKKK